MLEARYRPAREVAPCLLMRRISAARHGNGEARDGEARELREALRCKLRYRRSASPRSPPHIFLVSMQNGQRRFRLDFCRTMKITGCAPLSRRPLARRSSRV